MLEHATDFQMGCTDQPSSPRPTGCSQVKVLTMSIVWVGKWKHAFIAFCRSKPNPAKQRPTCPWTLPFGKSLVLKRAGYSSSVSMQLWALKRRHRSHHFRQADGICPREWSGLPNHFWQELLRLITNNKE